MKPQCLLSDFFGNTTFPHYLKMRDNTQDVSAEILFLESEEILVGSLVSIHQLQKNTRIFKVTDTTGKRKAKGDWKNYLEWPQWCKIRATLVGFWDNTNETISPEYITEKKAA